MSVIVFDVETVGSDFEHLDDISQESLLKYCKDDEEIETAKQSLGLYPVTAQIVTIAMMDAKTGQSFVYYQNLGEKKYAEENNTVFISGSEKDVLNLFWTKLKDYKQFVTFNGRSFDCPFIMARSAINQIRSPINLVPYRYDHKLHIDLADQLSFYGSMRRNFSLHMWCRAFGIPSPKAQGVSGDMVGKMYKEGRHLEIARYCLEDVQATKTLYSHWDKFLKF